MCHIEMYLVINSKGPFTNLDPLVSAALSLKGIVITGAINIIVIGTIAFVIKNGNQ